MRFEFPLQQGVLLRRYKRFMADILLDDDSQLTAHCPNTGSMKNCNTPESRVWFWDSKNEKRKYPHTWELVEIDHQHWACINTGRANKLVVEGIESGVIEELQGYQKIRTEVKYGAENSRIDILLEGVEQSCYVEVKNVTLLMEDGIGAFPDAVSARGTKHLRELAAEVEKGNRAVLLYCVAHTGIERVVPADHIDSEYGQELRKAVASGVEVYAYRTDIQVEGEAPSITLKDSLEVDLSMPPDQP
ncbi:MAG: DNA/RNA nuclease SfsA [Motiliproteus sp.]|nr:DNA/RNA nuclease SfsA [Motiliproteus sp.]MCW9053706.1 DNA/RNA nuclease SfsA [Motiliproteus sp.]